MKNLSLLVFMTQLGLSVAIPLAGFVILAVWLRDKFSLGGWVIVIGVVLGFIFAVSGFCSTLKTMEKLSEGDKDKPEHGVSFNEHD